MYNRAHDESDAFATRQDDGADLRLLAEATVARAIEDAAGEQPQTAYSAIRWLAGCTTDGLTFDRCCEMIGIPAPTVRRSLRNKSGPIRQRFEAYHKVQLTSTIELGRRR